MHVRLSDLALLANVFVQCSAPKGHALEQLDSPDMARFVSLQNTPVRFGIVERWALVEHVSHLQRPKGEKLYSKSFWLTK